jgi:outer membrane protein OmpA-like peptidoglycan-associated protein
MGWPRALCSGPGLGSAPGTPSYRVLAGLALQRPWAPQAAHGSKPLATASVSQPTEARSEAEPKPIQESASVSSPADDPPPAEVQPDLPKVSLEQLLMQEKIYFELGQPTLSRRSLPYLNNVAAALRDHPEVSRLLIQGHTDNLGRPAMNLKLSQARAEAVRNYLIMEGGVEAARLQAVGLGASRPQSPNETESGREANRRVEFVVLPAAEAR